MAVISREGIVRRLDDRNGKGLSENHMLLDSVIDIITEILKEGHEVRLQKFGTFKLKQCKERVGHIPKTKELTVIKEHTIVKFVRSNTLVESLKEVKIATV